MRHIDLAQVTEHVKNLCMETNVRLDDGFMAKLRQSEAKEESEIGRSVLKQIIKNSEIAQEKFVPMCQDTGIVVLFVELGNEVHFEGDLYDAINEGIRQGYKDAFLRRSIVKHPLDRVNTGDNTPGIAHVKMVSGDKIKISMAPKGGGSENMSRLTMLTPADGIEGVKKFVLETIELAGGKACPPLVVGVGIGGNFEKSAIIAKESIMRDIDDVSSDPIAAQLELDLLEDINKLGVGPMGFGGTTTALAVKVNVAACHIASLPVAVNLQCHASRHKSITF